MLKIQAKKVLDKFQKLKTSLKKSDFYFYIRDNIFLKEMKKEKKIEKNRGLNGMIEYTNKWYKAQTGKILHLNNPQSLTEKQQWVKFYDQDPLKVKCTDKYLVREYISKKIGSQHLVPLITVNGKDAFFNANEIDFNLLPNQFVISCNHGSSMTIVVSDKSKLSKHKIKGIKKKLNRWLKIEPAYIAAYDFVYKGIKPCIMITKFLENPDKSEINDYKFIAFNGGVKYMWIDSDRFHGHKRSVFNLDLTRAPFNINKYEPIGDSAIPSNYKEMLQLANILAKDFMFVRVDFYNVNNVIYFGELTFNSGGGVELPYPEEYDLIVGNELLIK